MTDTFIPLNDLPNRLRRQAENVEGDGWLSAARLMREAAYELEEYSMVRKDNQNDTHGTSH